MTVPFDAVDIIASLKEKGYQRLWPERREDDLRHLHSHNPLFSRLFEQRFAHSQWRVSGGLLFDAV
jgi:hypothetical protein